MDCEKFRVSVSSKVFSEITASAYRCLRVKFNRLYDISVTFWRQRQNWLIEIKLFSTLHLQSLVLAHVDLCFHKLRRGRLKDATLYDSVSNRDRNLSVLLYFCLQDIWDGSPLLWGKQRVDSSGFRTWILRIYRYITMVESIVSYSVAWSYGDVRHRKRWRRWREDEVDATYDDEVSLFVLRHHNVVNLSGSSQAFSDFSAHDRCRFVIAMAYVKAWPILECPQYIRTWQLYCHRYEWHWLTKVKSLFYSRQARRPLKGWYQYCM